MKRARNGATRATRLADLVVEVRVRPRSKTKMVLNAEPRAKILIVSRGRIELYRRDEDPDAAHGFAEAYNRFSHLTGRVAVVRPVHQPVSRAMRRANLAFRSA